MIRETLRPLHQEHWLYRHTKTVPRAWVPSSLLAITKPTPVALATRLLQYTYTKPVSEHYTKVYQVKHYAVDIFMLSRKVSTACAAR